jgi:hypothetical protein
VEKEATNKINGKIVDRVDISVKSNHLKFHFFFLFSPDLRAIIIIYIAGSFYLDFSTHQKVIRAYISQNKRNEAIEKEM